MTVRRRTCHFVLWHFVNCGARDYYSATVGNQLRNRGSQEHQPSTERRPRSHRESIKAEDVNRGVHTAPGQGERLHGGYKPVEITCKGVVTFPVTTGYFPCLEVTASDGRNREKGIIRKTVWSLSISVGGQSNWIRGLMLAGGTEIFPERGKAVQSH